jgi:hypothetical protein
MKKTTHTNTAEIDANTKLAEAVCKPILFSNPMVQALIRGEKTQTRRIVKQAIEWDVNWIVSKETETHYCMRAGTQYSLPFFTPKYQVGDILWVRETWRKANGFPTGYRYDWRATAEEDGAPIDEPWKPSIFMPKDACRIFLEVTDIRVERLNEITEADALAEGVERWTEERMKSKPTHYKLYFHEKGSECSYASCPIDSYETLWKKINGEKSWSENLFVWVYTFKQVERPYGFC